LQIIIAGKAHPHDTAGKEVIQSIIQKVRQYNLDKKIVFLEDYDMVIARYMVKGCDVWLNNPIRPMEASGTSGMKAGLNGTLNFSILDGWWDESFNGSNGFSIGSGEEYANHEEQEIVESGELYDTLEKVIIPMFYDRKSFSRIPEKWISYMKNSIKTIAGNFSTNRMIKDYSKMFYIPALNNYHKLSYHNASEATSFKEWKDLVKSEWANVEIIETQVSHDEEPYVGKEINVTAKVKLGKLTPNDVNVQVYYGTIDYHNELINTDFNDLQLVSSQDNVYFYSGIYKCPDTGKQGFTVRVLPTHSLMAYQSELYLCAWAK
jgi:glycogen phosphorylase